MERKIKIADDSYEEFLNFVRSELLSPFKVGLEIAKTVGLLLFTVLVVLFCNFNLISIVAIVGLLLFMVYLILGVIHRKKAYDNLVNDRIFGIKNIKLIRKRNTEDKKGTFVKYFFDLEGFRDVKVSEDCFDMYENEDLVPCMTYILKSNIPIYNRYRDAKVMVIPEWFTNDEQFYDWQRAQHKSDFNEEAEE